MSTTGETGLFGIRRTTLLVVVGGVVMVVAGALYGYSRRQEAPAPYVTAVAQLAGKIDRYAQHADEFLRAYDEVASRALARIEANTPAPAEPAVGELRPAENSPYNAAINDLTKNRAADLQRIAETAYIGGRIPNLASRVQELAIDRVHEQTISRLRELDEAIAAAERAVREKRPARAEALRIRAQMRDRLGQARESLVTLRELNRQLRQEVPGAR